MIELIVAGLALILWSVTLVLVCAWLRRRQYRQQSRAQWQAFKDEIVANKEPEKQKPECQSCQHFISCSMAGVTECPLQK